MEPHPLNVHREMDREELLIAMLDQALGCIEDVDGIVAFQEVRTGTPISGQTLSEQRLALFDKWAEEDAAADQGADA